MLMKNTFVFELVFGVLGFIALLLYISMECISEGWLFLPAFVMGICAIPMWFNRKKHFAFSDKEREALKEANKLSIITTLLFSIMLVIIRISNNFSERMTWGFVIAFVSYFFITEHGLLLLDRYDRTKKNN